MGRPLKIKQSTTIDIGFNPFNLLDQPTVVIPSGLTSAQYLGVVGGGYDGGVATAAYPTVAVNAYFPIAAAGAAAYIITQKGKTKYLVAAQATTAVTGITVGGSYIVNDLGDTNWSAIGAGVNPIIGDVFTATAVGAGTGLVSEVAVCFLTNAATGALTAGQMNIAFDVAGATVYASRLTNKYVWDYDTPSPNRYAANFFASGAAGTITLSTVAIGSLSGQFGCDAANLELNDAVIVSGTASGAGTITGYTDPTTYYIISTNGSTTFQLSATLGGPAVTTTIGATTGLTFTINPQSTSTAKSGADIATWENGTGELTLAQVGDYTA